MNIGIWQILLVILVILLLFGAGRIPRLMEDVGKGLRSFRKGMDAQGPSDSCLDGEGSLIKRGDSSFSSQKNNLDAEK